MWDRLREELEFLADNGELLGQWILTAALVAFAVLAVILLAYVVIGRLLPGGPRRLIWGDRNRAAMVVVASAVLAMAWIMKDALDSISLPEVRLSGPPLPEGIELDGPTWEQILTGPVRMVATGLVAIFLLALAVVLADRLLPGGRPTWLIAQGGSQGGQGAAAMLAAKLLAVALIVRANLGGSDDSMLMGPVLLLLIGLLGVLVLSLVGGAIGLSIPGRLREVAGTKPAAPWLIAAGYLVTAWIFV